MGYGVYVLGGVVLGALGLYAVNKVMEKNKPVEVNVKLVTFDNVPEDATAKISVVDSNGTEVIAPVDMETISTGEFKANLLLKKLPQSTYIVKTHFYKGNDYIGTIETPVVVPNDIGLAMPDRTVYGENKIYLSIRG